MSRSPDPRIAGPADAVRATEILTAAFHLDPVWGWAFPDRERRAAQHSVLWRFFVDAAIPHDWVWLTADRGACALWVPPGCPELSDEDEARMEPMLIDLVGSEQAEILLDTFERFDAAHPRGEPHYYLSLLGTHPDHRGRGIATDMVAANLALIDAAGMPASLESTNPANHRRYERLGFSQVGEFRLSGKDGPPVATMWRQARA